MANALVRNLKKNNVTPNVNRCSRTSKHDCCNQFGLYHTKVWHRLIAILFSTRNDDEKKKNIEKKYFHIYTMCSVLDSTSPMRANDELTNEYTTAEQIETQHSANGEKEIK